MSTETDTAAPSAPPVDPAVEPTGDPAVDGAPDAAVPAPSELEQRFTQLQGDVDTPSARLRLYGTQSDDPRDVHATVLGVNGEPLASSNAWKMIREKARERGLTAVAEAHGVLRIRVGEWPADEDEVVKEKEVASEPATPAKAPASGRRR